MICFLGLTKSYSCSCDTISFDEAIEWADEIFMGRLIQIREVETYKEFNGTPRTRIWGALFEVEKKWKGSSDKYVEVFQPNTSCDYYFDFPSQPYLVYAKKGELFDWDSTNSFVGLETWLCARNADASTYNLYSEYSFDDRIKLDQKFIKPITLARFNFNWKWVGIIILTLIAGIFLGRKLKE